MTQICVICDKGFEEYGNNPEPLKQEGRCCDDCNDTKVFPERLKQEKENRKKR